MKKILYNISIFIIFIIILVSCSTTKKTNKDIFPKYHIGENIYIKPDSTKGVIMEIISEKNMKELGLNIEKDDYYVIKIVDENGKTIINWIPSKKIY